MNDRALNPELVKFLQSVSTSTRFMEFMPPERLEKLPRAESAYIEELEDLLSRLSFEAEALLVRTNVGGRQ